MTFSVQIPKIYPKGWGEERWICNNEKYCGKILIFKKGKRCSFHHHNIKSEHFYLQSGSIKLKVSYEDDLNNAEEILLSPGDIFEIPTGLNHQMIALEDSELFEFSTFHMEEDSIRIVRGD